MHVLKEVPGGKPPGGRVAAAAAAAVPEGPVAGYASLCQATLGPWYKCCFEVGPCGSCVCVCVCVCRGQRNRKRPAYVCVCVFAGAGNVSL